VINDPINEENIIAENERRSSAWDIQNAPKNYASLVLAQGGSALFAFASVWLLTRSLGSEGYGSVVAVIAASQVVQVLVNWTALAVVKFGVDEFVETTKIARTFWVRFIILVPNAVLVLVTSRIWFPLIADWLKLSPDIIWLLFLHFAASVLWVHIQFSLQAIKMPRKLGVLLVIERVLIFTGLIVLFAAHKLDAFSAIFCYAAVPLLMAVIGLFYLRHFIFAAFTIDRAWRWKIIMFSLPLFPITLIGYLSGGYVDAVFISKFLSLRDLGIYSVAGQFNGLVLQLPTLANSLLIPLFISLEKENKTRKTELFFRDVLPSLTLAWGFFCTFIAFLGTFIIPVVLGAEFREVSIPFWILLVASSCGFPALLGYSAISHATSTTYVSMFAGIFAASANILFNFLLIPTYGIKGCAWATTACYLVSVLVYALFLKGLKKIVFSWTFTAMLPAVAGGVCYSVTENAWWSIFACGGIGLILILLQIQSIREAKKYLFKLVDAGSIAADIKKIFQVFSKK
jgi:O-antigen/teichoic acid export membrane protein